MKLTPPAAAGPLLGIALAGTLGLGLLAPGNAQTAAPVAGAPGIGDPYFPLDGNGGIDVEHYAIDIGYEFETRSRPAELSGTTTLTVRPKVDLRRFNLDLLLGVDAVRIDGAEAAFRKAGSHEVVITPAAPLAADEPVEVEVDYHGRPGRLSYLGESNWLSSPDEVVTVNEPHMAPWWFPANDHPRDKATFDITVTTDADKRVISNGEQTARTANLDGTATTSWTMTDPMTTYLAFFAAGDYAVTEGVSDRGTPYLTAISRAFSRSERRAFAKVFAQVGEVTDWFEREVGPYPFTSTGGLVTPLPAGFALENQTRPIYTGGFLANWVQVHEIAHQWFGDSVSVRRWRDIWINEGLATYFEVRYDEAHGGQSTRAWLRGAYRGWRPVTRFWKVDLANPGPGKVFDNAVYVRGAMVIAALRERIGRRDLRTLLRTWVADHHDATARVGDFERLAEEVSGKQLDGFFDAWLRSPKPPKPTRANGLR